MSEAVKSTPAADAAFQDWQEPHIYETPMEIAWQFKYIMGQEKLENLYAKAKQSQWDADEQLDWSIEIDPSKPLMDSQSSGVMNLSVIKKLSQSQRDEFSAHFAAQLLSQFLHGEQGALMTSAAVTQAVPDHDAKLYAATQTIAGLHADDLEDVAQFTFEAVKGMADSQGGADGSKPRRADPGFLRVLENCSIEPADFMDSIKEAGAGGFNGKLPPGHIHSFKDLMMPALVRVGAITERSRELYAAAGIPIWDDASVLESMEDGAAGDIVFPEA